MDFKKIFLKDACPTKIGGQAVLEGIMMKGEQRSAVVVRRENGDMYIKTQLLKKRGKWYKVPIIRGVLIFVDSLVTGIKTLTDSADMVEFEGGGEDGEEAYEETKFDKWLIKHFGEKAPMTFLMVTAVALALVFTIGIFILAPTLVVGLLGKVISNAIVLNLIEGVFRILLFVGYIVLVARMDAIKTTFQFHGAEHQCIHCYEGGKDLTPENCAEYETLHPRCGTSFLMFVMVIALLVFSLLGWPNPLLRLASRLLLIPVIAGLSFELLRWAGSSTSPIVKILSVPGLLLQMLTTKRPKEKQLEVAIAALKAVLVPENTPVIEGICNKEGNLIPQYAMPLWHRAAGELYKAA
jgi:uncharacterized protein YqhQ